MQAMAMQAMACYLTHGREFTCDGVLLAMRCCTMAYYSIRKRYAWRMLGKRYAVHLSGVFCQAIC
jgi:hypothetical protein